jgi:PAS domain-containing protein
MSVTKSRAELVARRAELTAELFLQDLDPVFVAQPSPDLAFHFFVGFTNPRRGINLTAVEVKSTERQVHDRFPIHKRLYQRLANSNIPVLILVVDVKQNRLYYSWPTQEISGSTTSNTIGIPLTEIDDNTKKELRNRLAG